MAYLVPSEFVTKMVDAGESKIFMATRDTVRRSREFERCVPLSLKSCTRGHSTEFTGSRVSFIYFIGGTRRARVFRPCVLPRWAGLRSLATKS